MKNCKASSSDSTHPERLKNTLNHSDSMLHPVESVVLAIERVKIHVIKITFTKTLVGIPIREQHVNVLKVCS